MKRFVVRDPPANFEERVRGPGLKWLAENPEASPAVEGRAVKKRAPSHWLAVQAEVAIAFGELCAYTCMWLSSAGEIDHFVSADEDRARAYEWSNYRYSAEWLNRTKQGLRSGLILDPFVVEDDWFEILLPSLQLARTERCPEEMHERADLMLDRLRLRNGSKVMRSRSKFYQLYNEGKATLDLLDELAPLIARAIRKRDEASGQAAAL